MMTVLRAAALSVLNQAVSSATNFMFGALLVRHLSADGFGAWGLAFSILLLALNLGDALFITPMTVAIAQTAESRIPSYVKTVFCGACAVTGVLVVPVAGVSAVIFHAAGTHGYMGIATAIGVAAFFFVVKETLVRILYALRREGAVLLVNASFGIIAVALAGLPPTRATNVAAAVAHYAAGAATACAVALGILRFFRGARVKNIAGEMTSLSRDGRWYLGSNIACWLRLQTPTFATAWTFGLGSVGMLNAGRLVVTPPVLANPALGQIALPRLSKLAMDERERARFTRGVLAFGSTLVATCATYCLVLWFAFDAISALILGPGHSIPKPIVASWCVFVMALAVQNAFEVALKARRHPKRILLANTASAGVALTVCLAVSSEVGVVLGAAAAELSGALMMFLLTRADGRLTKATDRAVPIASSEQVVLGNSTFAGPSSIARGRDCKDQGGDEACHHLRDV